MNRPLLRNFNLLAQTFAVIAIAAGSISILNWLPEIEIFEGLPSAQMKLLTALGCIFIGITVFHSVLAKAKQRKIYVLLPFLAFFMGAISISNYFLEFMTEEVTHTAPISGVTLVFLSLTLVLRSEVKGRFTGLSEFLTLGAIFVLFPAVIGYLYGVDRLYSLTAYSRISFLSTIALFLLSIAVALTMPKQRFMSFIYSESHVGEYYRKWFLLFFTAPVIAGWICLEGYERGAFDLRFALALVVITSIFFALVISWFWTSRLYKANQVVEFQNSELRESEKRFRVLAESMPQFVWSADSNGRMDYINERFSDFVGFTFPITKEAWVPIITKEYRDLIDQHWRTAVTKSSNLEVEFKMLDRKSGESRWFLARGVPAFGKNGRVEKWFGATTDINDYKVIQENLKISKNRLASIIHQGPLAIQIVSREGEVIQVNESWKKLYSVSDVDLEKMILAGYNAFTDSVLIDVGFSEISKRVLDGEFVFVPETEVHWSENENHPTKTMRIEAWISPIRNVDGVVSELCITINDVSDRKKATDEIQARQNELQAILDNSPAVIYMKDLNGKIILINNVFKEIFRGSDADFVGKYNEDIWPIDVARKFVENDLKVVTTKRPVREEESVPHYDGIVHTYLSTKFPIFDSDGKVRATCGISTDITDNKRKESERAELEVREKLAIESSRLKSEFLANMSHEIRTPINGIIGMTRLLSDTNLNQEQRNYARAITKSSAVLLTLINDILDLSKVESGKLELDFIPFSLDELIHDVKESFLPLMESKKIKFEVHGGFSSGRYFLGDPGRIRQILNNLIGNSLKFTSKGEIRLEVSLAERQKQLSEVHFSILDTGVGISDEKISSLFQKFFQVDSSTARKYGGTGLGLVICKQLVEMMKGSIGVKSKLE
ncbi:MAG: PAS domain-containing protein [Pseudobdellovibrionaceae bacterium]